RGDLHGSILDELVLKFNRGWRSVLLLLRAAWLDVTRSRTNRVQDAVGDARRLAGVRRHIELAVIVRLDVVSRNRTPRPRGGLEPNRYGSRHALHISRRCRLLLVERHTLLR